MGSERLNMGGPTDGQTDAKRRAGGSLFERDARMQALLTVHGHEGALKSNQALE
jgi:hypothetical protein